MEFYDFFQNFRMKENKEKIRAVSIKSSINETDLKVLQDKVDHLSLVCQAMCELLEQVGFDKTMLAKKIQEIDLRDGKLDGKFSQKKTCPQCERVVAARHIRCLYCGTETP